jgi:hypothetical protein
MNAELNSSPDAPEAPKSPEQKVKFKAAMKDVIGRVQRMGAGAMDLLKRLRKDKSPEEMLKTLEASLDANRARREETAKRVEQLHAEIARKKAEFAKASPARKRVLEAELKSMLTDYKTTERQMTILLENERNLAQVKGRLNEVSAYGMAGVTEDAIDDLIDEVDESVSEAEARVDAARDLEKAGKRREREGDSENLWDELAAFDEETDGAELEETSHEVEHKPEKGKREPGMEADKPESP